MRKNRTNPRRMSPRILLLSCLIACVPPAFAQSGDRAARAALWDSYQLPAGKFARFVDRQKGFSFRYPADWKQEPGKNGGTVFKPASETVNMIVISEEIPEGSGLANYVSGVMQSFRSEPIRPESVTVRRVMSGGLEWREISHEVEAPGGVPVRQTMWFTAVGPRAYGLALTAQNGEMEAHEPLFKRIVSSVRIGAAGHWNEEFETLRAAFIAGSNAESEIEAGRIAEALRTGRESFSAAAARIAELFASSRDAAIDLITDADPQVRTAAIAALGKSNHPQSVDLLIWALSDKDVFASSTAAQALAASGALGQVKGALATLAENPAAVIRAGVAMGDPASRELIEELLRSDSARQHLAALQLALVAEKFDLRLPFSKLLASTDVGALHTLVAVLRRHAGAEAANELIKFLRTDNELWAARALGEIAPAETAQELNKRIAEIDAQLGKLGHPAAKRPAPKKGQKKSEDEKNDSSETFTLVTAAELKKKPEDIRLALLRGQMDVATRKIKFRDRWDQAKTEAERRQIKTEINKEHFDLIAWSELALVSPAPARDNAANVDLAKLKDAPATGETLFPKESFSYVMAPDFAATMGRIDTALSGVQMATVRDQMTFALILKALKASLAARLGADVTGDASKATGVDLKSPIALASWQAPESKVDGRGIDGRGIDGRESAATRGAVTVRVTDRARFERLLATYQEEFGDFDQFFTAAAALSRFAGIIPAAAPVIFASLASDEARGKGSRRSRASSESKNPSLKPFSYERQESVGGLPITTLVRPVISELGGARWETIRIAYLGETAIVSSSRDAIADLLASGTSGETIAQSDAFKKSRAEKGEIIFFSRLNTMLKPLLELAEATEENEQIAAFIKAFSVESGALQLTPNSWETVFRIGLADNEFVKSFKPFKVDALAAPRELIPRSTILYAGAIVDPAKLYGVLKSLETAKDREKATERDKQIDADVEKLIVPNMQGEIAGALISLKPVYDGGEWPAMAMALKLKNGELAAAFRNGKLFAKFRRVSNATAAGSPVVALGEDDTAPFAAVTGDYFILADSVETLRTFEAKEKFSSSRDFARSTKDAPGDLAMFATYNLESAFDEASKTLDDGSSERMLPFLSAVIHAFHSQRAYLAVEKDGLVGRLSVAFDREGRYSVGDLANAIGDFDLANAMITPKGLTVIQSPRVEAMTLRVAARTPGVAPRVRDDLAKFDFQRVESSDDRTVVVTTSSRRIPEKLTIALPAPNAEFAPFLNPTARINSKDPRVVALAQRIAGDDRDGRSVARKIGEWTYRNLKWKKVESDTVETLASREADCLEHSELYVALARSLGLPARVVTGAALSGGSFGAHAWVEIYLGKWVELDPTWGLMNHVDATHLRFDGDAFTSYAMLNQLDLEITSARRATADYQRDPIRLVKEFSLRPATRDLAFDLSLTAEQALGPGGWNKLDEKQRAAVISAFEKTVNGMWETWDAENQLPPRILQSDIKSGRASFTLLRGDVLLRLTLASRDGAWFITEHEIVDDALPEFADALQGALRPERRRGIVFETSIAAAAKHVEKLIAADGEKPELLLLKSRVLSSQEMEKTMEAMNQPEPDKTEPGKAEIEKTDAGKTDAGKDPSKPDRAAASDPSVEVLKEIAKRWPDFAPGRLALARALLDSGGGEDAVNQISKDAEGAIEELKAYARLAPYDPRPWRDLADAYEQFDKLEDAEKSLEKAIELDREYLDHHAALVNFHLLNEHPDKARTAFARMLKANPDPDEIFGQFSDEEGYDPDYAKALENLLLAFPKELEGSVAGWVLLAGVQETQNKIGDAIKSMQRAIAIEPYASSFEYLSSLYRSQRRFTEALNAANQAIKLDDDTADAHFERACSLAQLGRKREALAALKRMLEIDPNATFDPDEPDLQPLAAMPEFKAMKEKMKESSAPAGETKPEGAQQEKTDKQKTGKP